MVTMFSVVWKEASDRVDAEGSVLAWRMDTIWATLIGLGEDEVPWR